MAQVKRVLELASPGIKIEGKDLGQIQKILQSTDSQEGFLRFQSLISILDLYSESDSLKTLSTVPCTSPSKDSENERVNVVSQFLSDNFRDEISLDKIASIANTTPNAFCMKTSPMTLRNMYR